MFLTYPSIIRLLAVMAIIITVFTANKFKFRRIPAGSTDKWLTHKYTPDYIHDIIV